VGEGEWERGRIFLRKNGRGRETKEEYKKWKREKEREWEGEFLKNGMEEGEGVRERVKIKMGEEEGEWERRRIKKTMEEGEGEWERSRLKIKNMEEGEGEWVRARLTPKIQGPFWWILGLKHVETRTYWHVGQWSKRNDVFLLPTITSSPLLC
jgi:hypothetical protein